MGTCLGRGGGKCGAAREYGVNRGPITEGRRQTAYWPAHTHMATVSSFPYTTLYGIDHVIFFIAEFATPQLRKSLSLCYSKGKPCGDGNIEMSPADLTVENRLDSCCTATDLGRDNAIRYIVILKSPRQAMFKHHNEQINDLVFYF